MQWWTSRGFAVLDVNYRGSTGFGRAYCEALDRQWGVADIEDCLAGVQAVLDRSLADPARCVIRGSSAGGLTVLGALAQSDLFAAGTSSTASPICAPWPKKRTSSKPAIWTA